jgi:hypothetical protein
MSTSDKAIGAASTMRCKNNELPKPNAAVTVPALVIGSATSARGTFWVKLSLDNAGFVFMMTIAPFPPLMEVLMPDPACMLAPTVMVLAFVAKVTPLPATRDTLAVVPFKVNCETDAKAEVFGPMMVMLGLVLSCDRVMPLPATKPNAVEEAVFSVPDVAPPAIDDMDVSTVPTVLVATPITVMLGLVLFCERVMLFPATRAQAVLPAVFSVPTVTPPFAAIVVRDAPPAAVFGPMIVMLGLVLFCERVTLFPATKAQAVLAAVFSVPTVAPPFAAMVVSVAPGFAPMTVILGLVLIWDKVMLLPATN